MTGSSLYLRVFLPSRSEAVFFVGWAIYCVFDFFHSLRSKLSSESSSFSSLYKWAGFIITRYELINNLIIKDGIISSISRIINSWRTCSFIPNRCAYLSWSFNRPTVALGDLQSCPTHNPSTSKLIGIRIRSKRIKIRR